MIAITEGAMEALFQLRLSAEIQDPGVALRLAPDAEGHLEVFADTEREGDLVVEREGAKLLLIAGDLSDLLAGATMDFRITTEGPQLVLDRASGGANGGGPPR
jgi:Fe-S cluster assembly iron-binding protein IscA